MDFHFLVMEKSWKINVEKEGGTLYTTSEWVEFTIPTSTHYRSFRRRVFPSFQSITRTGTDNLARTTKRQNTDTRYCNKMKLGPLNSTKRTQKKPRPRKRQSLVYAPFMTSGQEMQSVYSYNPGAHNGVSIGWYTDTPIQLLHAFIR